MGLFLLLRGDTIAKIRLFVNMFGAKLLKYAGLADRPIKMFERGRLPSVFEDARLFS